MSNAKMTRNRIDKQALSDSGINPVSRSASIDVPIHSYTMSDAFTSFVDPGWRSFQTKLMSFAPMGHIGTQALTYFENVLFPIYDRAFQTSIRFQTAFVMVQLESAIDNVAALLRAYYTIINQIQMAQTTVNRGLQAVVKRTSSDYAILQALDKARIVLETSVLPPNVHEIVYRLSQVYYTSPTCEGWNSPYWQFINSTVQFDPAITPATIAGNIETLINTVNSISVSTEMAKLKRLMPSWSINLRDAQTAPSFDVTMSDIADNLGREAGGVVLPNTTNYSVEHRIFTRSAKPSVLIGAMHAVAIGTLPVYIWQPGLVMPYAVYTPTIEDNIADPGYGQARYPANLSERSTQSSQFRNAWEVSVQAQNAGYGANADSVPMEVTGNSLLQDMRTVMDWLFSIDEVGRQVSSRSY